MRFEGKLLKWNDDRGFGFIAPVQGGQEVFVHISAFPRDGQRPQLHEALSFGIELDNKGKKRAVGVLRPAGSPSAPRRLTPVASTPGRPSRHATDGPAKWVAMLLLVALGVYGYGQYSKRVGAYPSADTGQPLAQPLGQEVVQLVQPAAASFRCDGRQHCSQMTSCAEATFFLKNCPGVKMDGDGDGVPCEQQWCSRP